MEHDIWQGSEYTSECWNLFYYIQYFKTKHFDTKEWVQWPQTKLFLLHQARSSGATPTQGI